MNISSLLQQLDRITEYSIHPSSEPIPIQIKAVQDSLKFNTKASEIHSLFKILSVPQQAQWLHFKKLAGNRLYNHSFFEQAFWIYTQALIASLLLNDQGITTILICNLGSCMIKLQQYEKALKILEKPSEGLNNSRVIQRKGFAYLQMGDLQQAKLLFNQALSLSRDPNLTQLINRHLASLSHV